MWNLWFMNVWLMYNPKVFRTLGLLAAGDRHTKKQLPYGQRCFGAKGWGGGGGGAGWVNSAKPPQENTAIKLFWMSVITSITPRL